MAGRAVCAPNQIAYNLSPITDHVATASGDAVTIIVFSWTSMVP
jgi:hypothetical protein